MMDMPACVISGNRRRQWGGRGRRKWTATSARQTTDLWLLLEWPPDTVQHHRWVCLGS